MKLLFISLMLLIGIGGYGQRVSPCHYKKVDSVFEYKDAETIVYKNRYGKLLIDTIYYSKQKCNIHIEYTDFLFSDTRKKLNHK